MFLLVTCKYFYIFSLNRAEDVNTYENSCTYENTQTMVLSIVLVVFIFTIPMYFLGNILFITQLKLSLDSLLLSNQKNGVLGYSLFAYGP